MICIGPILANLWGEGFEGENAFLTGPNLKAPKFAEKRLVFALCSVLLSKCRGGGQSRDGEGDPMPAPLGVGATTG